MVEEFLPMYFLWRVMLSSNSFTMVEAAKGRLVAGLQIRDDVSTAVAVLAGGPVSRLWFSGEAEDS